MRPTRLLRSLPFVFVIFLISTAFADDGEDGVEIPRGVPINKASFYRPSAEFRCLDDSFTIPYDQVNDDYCDCEDGSDEPGTSACPNSRFHCLNLGHTAEDIPSSRVNDGICDCCDGSDEWSGAASCSNICQELGRGAREQRERAAQLARTGFAGRRALVEQAKKLKEEKEQEAAEARASIDELKTQRDEAEKKKEETESAERAAKDAHRKAWQETRDERRRQQAEKLFKLLDRDADGKLTAADIQADTMFDENHDGKVDDEETKRHLKEAVEVDLENFLANQFDDFRRLLRDKIRDEREKAEDEKEAKKDEEEEAANEEDGDEDDHKDEDDQPEPPNEWDDDPHEPPFPEDVQQLIEASRAARTAHSDLDRRLTDLERVVKDADAFAGGQFGRDLAWAPLKGQCLELDDSQYTYRLCLFDKAVQKDKNGHNEVTLGYWGEWTGDGDATSESHYARQKYDKGQACWNGPERSTEVLISCGAEGRLIEASEPGRCEYRFLIESPAACEDPDATDGQGVHTEL